jgi:predicted nuclease of predicted toxin-antitoxin system
MSVSFYMDVNVRAEITKQLRVREVDVLTAEQDGMRELPDSQLLDRATNLNRVLFTRDADLLGEAVARQRSGALFAGIIYAHQMQVTIGQCVENLELIAKISTMDEWIDRIEYLPMK